MFKVIVLAASGLLVAAVAEAVMKKATAAPDCYQLQRAAAISGLPEVRLPGKRDRAVRDGLSVGVLWARQVYVEQNGTSVLTAADCRG